MITRIRKIIEAESLTRSDFAKKIEMSKYTLDGYLDGKNKPSLPLAEGILRAYPDISAEWLMRGEGSMYRSNGSTINYEINAHSQVNKGDAGGMTYGPPSSCEEELKALKEKEKLYLLQIAELKNDKQFLQSIIKNQ